MKWIMVEMLVLCVRRRLVQDFRVLVGYLLAEVSHLNILYLEW